MSTKVCASEHTESRFWAWQFCTGLKTELAYKFIHISYTPFWRSGKEWKGTLFILIWLGGYKDAEDGKSYVNAFLSSQEGVHFHRLLQLPKAELEGEHILGTACQLAGTMASSWHIGLPSSQSFLFTSLTCSLLSGNQKGRDCLWKEYRMNFGLTICARLAFLNSPAPCGQRSQLPHWPSSSLLLFQVEI